MSVPQELLTGVYTSLVKVEGVTQIHGYFQRDTEGLHVVYNGKRYLITVVERPVNDGGMTLYEMAKRS